MNQTEFKSSPLQRRKLLVLSFVEGASVMVAELAGGKMLAPYYGTSLYVWASTLAITLGGLAIGYYVGGRLSEQETGKKEKALFLTIAAASGLVMLMPVLASFIMMHSLNLSFLTGLVVSQLCFLLPPVFCMGMVSPLLISLLAGTNNSGKAAGSVYAISTLGGVIATLLTGFWLVPLIGISIPCMVIGALLFVINVLLLRPKHKVIATFVFLLLIPGFLFIKDIHSHDEGGERFKVLYHTEGIMGQVMVMDFNAGHNGKKYPCRSMLVNHNWQTWIDPSQPGFSFLYYTRFTRAIINSLPHGSNALLIGLGGGTVARQMEQQQVAYDAVEIDQRLPGLAKRFFGLKGMGNIFVDDGRHFINKCAKKYDLIIIDALLGENVPSHLLSVESFEIIKKLLQPAGKLFIEFDGIDSGTNGMAQNVLFNTIRKAGLQCNVYGSVPGSKEEDIMFLASTEELKTIPATVDSDSYYPYSGLMDKFRVQLSSQTSETVTDDKPSLDYYLSARMVRFRQEMLLKFNKDFLEDDISFFF